MTIVNKRILIENNANSYDCDAAKIAFAVKVFNALQKEGLISKNIKPTSKLPATYNSELIEDAVLEKNLSSYTERIKVSLFGKGQPKTYGELFKVLVGDVDKNGKLDVDVNILNRSGVLSKKISNKELADVILKWQNNKVPNIDIKGFKIGQDSFDITQNDVAQFTPTLQFVEKEALPGKAPYSYAVDKTLIIDASVLGKTLGDALAKEIGIKNLKLTDKSNNYSELRTYLEGSTKVNYKTGNESKLRSWILSQPDNSVDPVKLTIEAVKLNGNNLFKGLLCTHELLRNEARFDAHYTTYNSTYEDKAKFFNKFIDIRGDLVERNLKLTGDHSGTWYRIFGTQLYSLDSMVNKDDDSIETELITDRILGHAVSKAAEAIKPVIGWYEQDWRKSELNSKGVEIMYHLLNKIEDYRDSKIITPKNIDINPDKYLIPEKEFSINPMYTLPFMYNNLFLNSY